MSASTPGAGTTVISDHAWHVPGPELRPWVAGCSGFRYAGIEPTRHRGLPSPYLTLIFTLDEPLVLASHPDPRQPAGSYQTLVGGLHAAPAMIVHDGWQSGVQLMLRPLGVRALFGVPAGELAHLDVQGDAVLGRMAAEIQDRLRCAPAWPERFAILDEMVRARIRAADESAGVSAEVRHAWARLLRTGGRRSVSSLAAETGWSERYLRTRFLADIGLAPKTAGRVIRFHRARQELARRAAAGGRLGLAELAAAYGYFDQAHLDREFRLMAGCSPTQWISEEFRNIQSGGLHPDEDW